MATNVMVALTAEQYSNLVALIESVPKTGISWPLCVFGCVFVVAVCWTLRHM